MRPPHAAAAAPSARASRADSLDGGLDGTDRRAFPAEFRASDGAPPSGPARSPRLPVVEPRSSATAARPPSRSSAGSSSSRATRGRCSGLSSRVAGNANRPGCLRGDGCGGAGHGPRGLVKSAGFTFHIDWTPRILGNPRNGPMGVPARRARMSVRRGAFQAPIGVGLVLRTDGRVYDAGVCSPTGRSCCLSSDYPDGSSHRTEATCDPTSAWARRSMVNFMPGVFPPWRRLAGAARPERLGGPTVGAQSWRAGRELVCPPQPSGQQELAVL